jgi:hypothetical protein
LRLPFLLLCSMEIRVTRYKRVYKWQRLTYPEIFDPVRVGYMSIPQNL